MQQYGGYNGGGYGQQQNPYNQNTYGDGGRGYDGQSPPGGRYGGARKCFYLPSNAVVFCLADHSKQSQK